MAAEKIRITTLKGLVPSLKHELELLEYTVEFETANSVIVAGNYNDAVWLNLNLRTAYHVLYPLIKPFYCSTPDELYGTVYDIRWEEWLAPSEKICITSTVDNPTINDSRFPNMRVKDAIVDRMRDAVGRRPDSGPETDCAVIRLYWKNNTASVYIDTSGEPLSRRGYRKVPCSAPMQEPLAAAVVMTTRWENNMPFVNPMCGSGTLAIEAALMAVNKAPGLIRKNYGFMHFLRYSPNHYEACIEELKEAEKRDTVVRIRLSDHDQKALKAAKINAQAADIANHLQFEHCDFRETTLFEEPFVAVLNPEYGIRMGEQEALVATYKGIGDFFKQRCAGSTGYIFSGNRELLKRVGLAPQRRIPFFSAKIECRLHEYEIYPSTAKDL